MISLWNKKKFERESDLEETLEHSYLAIPFSDSSKRRYLIREDYKSVDSINKFTDNYSALMYLDVCSMELESKEKNYKKIILVLNEENKQKFKEDLGLLGNRGTGLDHLIYSDDTIDKMKDKREYFHRQLKENGRDFDIFETSGVSGRDYLFIPKGKNSGYKLKNPNPFILEINNLPIKKINISGENFYLFNK